MQVVDIDRIVVATDDVEETSGTLSERLDIAFGDRLTLTTETSAGANELQSVIDRNGIGLDLIQPASETGEDAVSEFVEKNGTGLYAIAFQVADLAAAQAELAEDGIDPVGEIAAGGFTEYLYHPRDFDGLFVFLAEFPHAYETNYRLDALRDNE
ncbi:VOC family protein [Halorientalis sp.]|jgi:4-hydroxyphenylpyruvate dioxygenase-like putative hemolysin|uniref:VOC family protein n=1 Tax=Halorientalis sp. TaxID=1931229 RepID=UPI002611EA0E|nr:VOC family protein [Halorientalis sp.]